MLMAALRLLAVAAATGRIGYVFFIGHELVAFDLSRKGFKNTTQAAAVFQEWILAFKPNVVVTERLPKKSKKGQRARKIIQTFAQIASHNYVYDITVTPDREGRSRHAHAVHLSDIYPDITHRLPRKPKFYESEDRAMILFDALTLAHIILQDPTLKLAAALDTPMARR
jgi:hypothetical protein